MVNKNHMINITCTFFVIDWIAAESNVSIRQLRAQHLTDRNIKSTGLQQNKQQSNNQIKVFLDW